MIEIKVQLYNFSLVKTSEGKFAHTAENGNKYVLLDCTAQSSSNIIGRQSVNVVKPVFEGTKVFRDIKACIDNGQVDKETGKCVLPLEGKHFVKVPTGFPYTSVDKKTGRTFTNTTVSFMIFGDENYESALASAIRAAAKTRIEDVNDGEAIIEQQLNAPKDLPKEKDEF